MIEKDILPQFVKALQTKLDSIVDNQADLSDKIEEVRELACVNRDNIDSDLEAINTAVEEGIAALTGELDSATKDAIESVLEQATESRSGFDIKIEEAVNQAVEDFNQNNSMDSLIELLGDLRDHDGFSSLVEAISNMTLTVPDNSEMLEGIAAAVQNLQVDVDIKPISQALADHTKEVRSLSEKLDAVIEEVGALKASVEKDKVVEYDSNNRVTRIKVQ